MPTPLVEVVIEGPRGWALGFVEGFLRGRNPALEVIDAESEGFEVESRRERLRELFQRASDTVHLLVPASAVPAVREAVASIPPGRGPATLLHERALASASFSFEVAAYSREHGERIRGLLERLPEGTRLSSDTHLDESVHPEEEGIEVYAPAHAYELRGEGTVAGPVEGVLAVHRACRAEELVRIGRISLVETLEP